MSRPVGYRNQSTCQNCKFVYRSDLNCYCIYDDYPLSDRHSIKGFEQLDEYEMLNEYDSFYKWRDNNIVTDTGICDLYEDEFDE